MEETIVRTKEELERALKNRTKKIVYEGQDAEKVLAEIKKAEKKKASTRRWAFGLGALAVLAAPFTGGASLFGLGATVGAIALSDAVIIAIIGAIAKISIEAIKALKEYLVERDRNRMVFTHKS
ncbi:MAG: hypothetical protein HDT06_06195 [Bacteroidales bacterium]|nr:hypothetical protein [Bacteroidales bacterium]